MRQTTLDRAIAWLAPEAGLRRAKARARTAALLTAKAYYDAASVSRRANNWRRTSTDANSEIRGNSGKLRDLSRDLVRNNPWAAKAVAVIAANVVGAGIIPQVKARSKIRTDQANALLRSYIDTTLCDADGRRDFYGIQALAMRAMVESGEVLIRRRRRFASDGLPLPMQVQVLESDYLDSLKDGLLANGNIVIQGVEFDRIGRRVAYWLYDTHPGSGINLTVGTSRRIPADDVIHLYRDDRPGQVRGVPWGAPVFVRLKDYGEYEDAQLVRQKIAACFAVFVRDMEDSGVVPSDASSANSELLETLEPGVVETLPPGKDVQFAAPPGVEGYEDYARASLRAVAAGFGVPYEALTGDLSNVNFSSGRMGWLEFQRNIAQWQWMLFVPTVCRQMERWVTEAALLVGFDFADAEWTWTPPRREMIDPAKENAADRDAVRAGLASWSETVRGRGYDPDKLLDELQADQAEFDRRALKLASDPRNPLNGGPRPSGDQTNA